jgi:APA family basic amino acid/polyamine antiporter
MSVNVSGEAAAGDAARPAYFTRKATGLVRDVSPVSAGVYNLMTAAPGLFAAISGFFALSIFPRANVIISLLLTVPISLAVGYTFGKLQAIFPRTGGDYVINSRTLGPRAGTASTLLNSAAAVVGMGFFAYAFVVSGLQPMMAMIGTTSGSNWFLDAATSLTHQGWQAFAALSFLAVGVAICAVPIRVTMRVQTICVAIAMTGFVLGLLVLWFTSKNGFISNYNGYAGGGAYAKATAAGGTASYTLHDTILAIGTIAAYTVFQWWSMYFAGEIKGLERRSVATMLAPTVFYFTALLLMIGTIVTKFDHGFLVAANTGDPSYTLAAPPFWTFLATICGGSTFWAVLFGATFLFWFPLLAIVQLVPPIRSIFALAFDGVLPRFMSKVDPRTHIPVAAVVIVALTSVGCTVWAIFAGTSFFSASSYSSYLALWTMLFLSVTAIVLPYRRRALWESSPGATRLFGIPTLTIGGVLAFCGSLFIIYLFDNFRQFGIPSGVRALEYVALTIALGIVLYTVAKAVRAREGIDLDRNYQEIPPE